MIGRKEEIKELIELYDSKEAQFVAVYGRRRVGKTYLINETFQGKFTYKRLLPEKELANSRVHKKTALFRKEIRPNLVPGLPRHFICAMTRRLQRADYNASMTALNSATGRIHFFSSSAFGR